MRILIVSGQEFSETNRGIDTITKYFIEKKYMVTHLMVGINSLKKFKKKRRLNISNFKQIYSKKSIFSYVGIMGKIFPNIFLKMIKKYQEKLVSNIKFKNFDLIVLETGKPLFIIDKIPLNIPIILRMSDPIEFSFNNNKEYFKKLEREAIKRANLILIAHQKLFEYYKEYNNIEYWRTGFDEKKIQSNELLNKAEEELFYMGNTQIDFELLENIIKLNPKISINIVGNHQYKSKNSHLKIYGYLDSREYIEYLQKSKCYIMPFNSKEVEKMKMLGMTSKFYVAMQLGKPILVRRYGEIQKDNLDLNIFTYDSLEEANEKLKYILKNNFSKNLKINLFLENLKNENRKKELDMILKKYKLV